MISAPEGSTALRALLIGPGHLCARLPPLQMLSACGFPLPKQRQAASAGASPAMAPAAAAALTIEGLALPPPVVPPVLGVSPVLGPAAMPAMGVEALRLPAPVASPVLGATAALQPAAVPAAEPAVPVQAAVPAPAPTAQPAGLQSQAATAVPHSQPAQAAPLQQLEAAPAAATGSHPASAASALATEQVVEQQLQAEVPAAVAEPSLQAPLPPLPAQAAEPAVEQQLPTAVPSFAVEPAKQVQAPAAEPMAVDTAGQWTSLPAPQAAEQVPAQAAPAARQPAAVPAASNDGAAIDPLAMHAALPNGSHLQGVKVEHEEQQEMAGFAAAPLACMQPAALPGPPPVSQGPEVRQLRDPSLQPISGTIGHRRGRGNGQPALADADPSRPRRTVRRPARRFDDDFEAPEPDSDEVRRRRAAACMWQLSKGSCLGVAVPRWARELQDCDIGLHSSPPDIYPGIIVMQCKQVHASFVFGNSIEDVTWTPCPPPRHASGLCARGG